jgi:hypothetical protein
MSSVRPAAFTVHQDRETEKAQGMTTFFWDREGSGRARDRQASAGESCRNHQEQWSPDVVSIAVCMQCLLSSSLRHIAG